MRNSIVLAVFIGFFLGKVAFAQKYESPAGLVLSEDLPENDKTWYFCPNGNLQMTEDVYPEKSIYQGKWKIHENRIIIDLKIQYGKRGVGEPWVSGEQKGFNEYVDFVHEKSERIILPWNELLGSASNEKEPWGIVKTSYTCPAILYHPQLPGKFPVASYRLLKEKDFAKLSKEELDVMRNEIYARYGLKFISSKDFDYFMKQDWYFGDKKSVDHLLTTIEKRNLRAISVRERKIKK